MADTQLTSPLQFQMASVHKLAETCKYDSTHSELVAHFSLSLFDGLQSLHQYSTVERCWLEMAGILHDIGWIEGRGAHHKTSLKIILNSPMLNLSNKERLIVGSIARYHRKSLPGLEHDHFAALEPEERKMVVALASLLRLADGLDHLGDHRIKSIFVEPNEKNVNIICKAIADFSGRKNIVPKADLFEIVFRRSVEIKWSVLL